MKKTPLVKHWDLRISALILGLMVYYCCEALLVRCLVTMVNSLTSNGYTS